MPAPEPLTVLPPEGGSWWKTMYHTTTPEAAGKILASKRFLPGGGGFLGSGIYFSTTASEACHRARIGNKASAVTLRADVRIGRVGVWPQGSVITPSDIHHYKLDSAKVDCIDSYAIFASNSYRQNPAKRIRNIAVESGVPDDPPAKRRRLF
mmetsp:Transcript_19010/g.47583  ORF Transcript_19010/g.47583 Transcript_19010/m.47583 type:complete len:152 (+) Transcript_19010:121-576(+)|eukprot:g17711.t1